MESSQLADRIDASGKMRLNAVRLHLRVVAPSVALSWTVIYCLFAKRRDGTEDKFILNVPYQRKVSANPRLVMSSMPVGEVGNGREKATGKQSFVNRNNRIGCATNVFGGKMTGRAFVMNELSTRRNRLMVAQFP
ncbi:hypothetical protein TTRE_0000378701 [Trichuris trichiura]|uniref:Uncharacterized protein n=1 Tax=Trichuris trichiura TaxID=36087 RepID=A0A077Z9Y1_TRITR|nr:hypothetical protein TTRE_0000378701 [Trichuris trichiura]